MSVRCLSSRVVRHASRIAIRGTCSFAAPICVSGTVRHGALLPGSSSMLRTAGPALGAAASVGAMSICSRRLGLATSSVNGRSMVASMLRAALGPNHSSTISLFLGEDDDDTLRMSADNADEQRQKRRERIEKIMALTKAYMAIKLAKSDNTPALVLHKLYIGSIGAAYNLDSLLGAGITHVLCVARDIAPRFPDTLTYKCVPLLDSPECSILGYLDECEEFVDVARAHGGGVLVHCFAGKSRSAAVVVAYLMKKKLWRFRRALAYLKGKRAIVQPNVGFVRQLLALERQWFSVHSPSNLLSS